MFKAASVLFLALSVVSDANANRLGRRHHHHNSMDLQTNELHPAAGKICVNKVSEMPKTWHGPSWDDMPWSKKEAEMLVKAVNAAIEEENPKQAAKVGLDGIEMLVDVLHANKLSAQQLKEARFQATETFLKVLSRHNEKWWDRANLREEKSAFKKQQKAIEQADFHLAAQLKKHVDELQAGADKAQQLCDQLKAKMAAAQKTNTKLYNSLKSKFKSAEKSVKTQREQVAKTMKKLDKTVEIGKKEENKVFKDKTYHAHKRSRSRKTLCESLDEIGNFIVYSVELTPKSQVQADLVALFNQNWKECKNALDLYNGEYAKNIKGGPAVWSKLSYDRGHGGLYGVWMRVMDYTAMWAVPGVERSFLAQTQPIAKQFWDFMKTHRMRNWNEYKDWDHSTPRHPSRFCDEAFMATHLPYLMSSYSSYALKPEYNEWLYNYFRVNFYKMTEQCSMDLVAEVTDNLKQYGCDEMNDRQIRDGMRYMLHEFEKADEDWTRQVNHDERGPAHNQYSKMHKPWTAQAALSPRSPLPLTPGSYGDIVLRVLEPTLVASVEKSTTTTTTTTTITTAHSVAAVHHPITSLKAHKLKKSLQP